MALSDPQEPPLDEPLLFERISLRKVWGGRMLEQVPGIELGLEGPIGETWELSDHADRKSVVRSGSHAGRTLHELVREHPQEILGSASATEEDGFPLLIKYISASKPLSVQVHPDDRSAKRLHAGESGKDEAWYILAAEPGSLIYLGLQPGIDANSFAGVAAGEGVVDVLQPWPVKAGQVINVPAGTLHAIGEGITLVEVQRSSDVTYRLFDWGRLGLDGEPRKTHVNEALLVIDYDTPVIGPLDPEFVDELGARRADPLIDSPAFEMSLLDLSGHVDADTDGRALIYIVVEGAVRLDSTTRESSWELSTGDTWLVPAVVGAHRLEATAEDARIIVVRTRTQ